VANKTAVTEDARCSWCLSSDLYKQYHDDEWGVPCHDPVGLFEMINLEGAQAGLSWITILNKREGYRKLFHQFDPVKIARMSDKRLDIIASNPAIVRHRQKVEAVRSNAIALLAMQDAGEDFADYIWSFVNHTIVQNNPKKLAQVPASTDTSLLMSKQLKKRGFKFVGATTCYAFMQAAGLVNDHLTSCPRHEFNYWPKRFPLAASHASSSAVLVRSKTLLRCGYRPKRSIICWCSSAESSVPCANWVRCDGA